MLIVIFSAILMFIFTIIVILVHRALLLQDESIKALAKENSAFDIQADHEQFCSRFID